MCPVHQYSSIFDSSLNFMGLSNFPLEDLSACVFQMQGIWKTLALALPQAFICIILTQLFDCIISIFHNALIHLLSR